MKPGFLLTLLIFIASIISNAQQGKCLIDYSGLKKEISTETNFEVGSCLHIRPQYMKLIGDANRSDYQYYRFQRYMRSATSKERSLGATSSTFETIIDGRVYKNELTFSSYGFFVVSGGFGGSYDLIQDEKKSNLVPFGLFPADIKSLSKKSLKLIKAAGEYLLFAVDQMKIVYYRNEFLPLYEVFEYANNRILIKEKGNDYDFLIDKRVKVVKQQKDLFVRRYQMTDFSSSIYDELELTVTNIESFSGHSVIHYTDKFNPENSLLVDPESDFLMYDCLCLEGKDEFGNAINLKDRSFNCRISYAGLKKKIEVHDRFDIGEFIYVKNEFLHRIVGAKSFDYRYFQFSKYARRANASEIELGFTSSYFEKIINGQVYKNELTFESYGFFKAGGGFKGSHTLRKNGENSNQVPFGLFPENVNSLANTPFKLVRLNDEYLLLNHKGKKIVYYRNPELPLNEVFENTYFRGLMTRKKSDYAFLIKKKVRIERNKQPLLFRANNLNTFSPLLDNNLEFVVDDIECYPDRSFLIYKDRYGSRYSVLIDSKTDFILYDGLCMDRKKVANRIMEDDISDRIDLYAKGILPLTALKEDTLTQRVLFSRFNYVLDANTGIEWYNHKDQSMKGNLMSKYLKMTSTKEGYAYLMSLYASSDPLYHTSIKVNLGDATLVSSTIPASGFDNTRVVENQSGNVWETVHYTNGRDNGIAKMIAKNVEKKIGVRFIGGKNFDIQLSEMHKKAIRDTYVLSSYLKLITKNKSE